MKPRVETAADLVTPLLGTLVYAMTTSNDHYDLFRDYMDRLNYALIYIDSIDCNYHGFLRVGLQFIHDMKRCPVGGIKVIEEYQNHWNETWGVANDGLRSLIASDGMAWEEEILLRKSDSRYPGWLKDIEVVMLKIIATGRTKYYLDTYKLAGQAACGMLEDAKESRHRSKDFDGLTGLPYLEQARLYTQRKFQEDPFIAPAHRGVSGDIGENLSLLADRMDDALRPKNGERLLTRIAAIDQNMLIGPQHNKWIGILSYTGSGKSTFTKSLCVTFAQQGAHVLFVPREESPESAMRGLAWINAEGLDIPNLPSLRDWDMRPETMTPENQQAKDEAMDAFGRMDGSIEVIHARTLQDVMDHYEANKKRRRYTVLAIDYVAKLETNVKRPTGGYQDHIPDFQALQSLSLNENLVILTPLQANKKGFAAAEKLAAEMHGVWEDCSAVDFYSAAAQDMDCVLGCWYRGDMKATNHMRLSNPKPPRHGSEFNPVTVYVDPITRAVIDLPSTKVMDQKLRRDGKRAGWDGVSASKEEAASWQ